MVNKPETEQNLDWVRQARAHGLGGLLAVVLDVIEPFAPLLAQGLWVFQPIARIFGQHDVLGAMAQTLDEPDGVTRIRDELGR